MMDLGMAYCANRPLQDVFYIGEMASHDDTPAEAASFRNSLTIANSYGAVYFPWVKAPGPDRPVAVSRCLLPPSGYVAGLYARIDAARGVWKAPAGTEASLNGSGGTHRRAERRRAGQPQPDRRGCHPPVRRGRDGRLRRPYRHLRPEWRYVPVRRTAIMLRVSIYYGIQWAVFEPNDEPLWAQLRLNIGSFMTTLFRQGAFQGATPSQAFFVKCDCGNDHSGGHRCREWSTYWSASPR